MAEDLILTPGGYRPRSRVHHVPPEHEVRMNGDTFEIHHRERGFVSAVGQLNRHERGQPLFPTHQSPLKPANRRLHESTLPMEQRKPFANPRIMTPGAQDGIIDGWVSFVAWTNDTGQSISQFSTAWTVPPAPKNVGDQTIFLFNGIQNASMIFQPVLQWGTSAAGGGQKWSVASWYAGDQNSHAFYSLMVDVAEGDALAGVMSLTDQNGALCSYSSTFDKFSDTTLPIFNVDELTWANETLETYGVKGPDDFPNTGSTIFSAINLRTGAGVPNIQWAPTSNYPNSGSQAKPIVNSCNGGSIEVTY